jgi:type II secretory pathway pseudopilin PulG
MSIFSPPIHKSRAEKPLFGRPLALKSSERMLFLAFVKGVRPAGPPSRGRAAGMTLLEILVAATIALLLFGVIIQLALFAIRVSRGGAERVELQQKVLVASNRLLADLQPASKGGVAMNTDQAALSIHPRRVTSQSVTWSPDLVLYRHIGTDLRRQLVACPRVDGRVYRPESPQSWMEVLGAAARETSKTSGVTRFAVALDTGALVRFELDLQVGTRSLTVQRAVALRQGN